MNYVGIHQALSEHKSSLMMLVGLLAFLVYLGVFVRFDSLMKFIESLNFEQYLLYYSVAVAALFLSVFFDSLIWYSLLEGLNAKMKLAKIVLYNWIGNFGNGGPVGNNRRRDNQDISC